MKLVRMIYTWSRYSLQRPRPAGSRALLDVDKARFPDIPVIDDSLSSTGFTDIKHEEIRVENIPMDDEFLRKVKGKYVSTYHLLPQDEFEHGIARLKAFIRNSRQTEYREWRGTLIYGRKYG